MKKILRIPLLFVALFLSSIPISAHDFEIDGIYYNILSDSTVEVTYRGRSFFDYSNEYTGVVTIPSTITYGDTKYSVTLIGTDAFNKCSGLTSLTIPNSVTSISYNAFSGCTGLTEVNYNAENCTSMGYSSSPAFSGCTNLITINIGNNVKTIPSCAFKGCSGLTSVTIPNSVTEIGTSAFSGCTGLTEVNYNAENCTSMGSSSYPAFSGCTNLITINIGNNVKTIPSYVFYGCTGLTSVTIPNSVTEIGSSAFSGCTGLTSVTIPNSVTEIGTSAFSGCTGLTEVNYNAENCTFMGYSSYPAFSGCTNLITINIGNNVKTIPSYVFYGCTGLTSVTIPNSVTEIGSSAFSGCTGLTSVTIPNSVTEIGSSAFYDCISLSSVTIPNSVAMIEDYAFSRCEGLTELTIKDGTDTLALGRSPFTACPFDKLYIGRNLSYELSSIYDSPFGFTETLKSVTIGNFVTSIGDYLFASCDGLNTISIPNSVVNIGKYAFHDCSGLTSVTIGNSVSTIGDWAFYWCKGLTNLAIPNSVTEIGSSAFYGCSGLRNVNISDISAWCKIDFDNKEANPLTYAGNLILNGSRITNLIIPNDITEIKNYSFSGCEIFSLTIGSSVTSIGYNAFLNSSLSNISLPNSLKRINDNAFEYCNNLISCYRQVSQTAITITKLSTPTEYTPYFNYKGNSYSVADKITGLTPNTQYYYDYGLIINGIYCQINSSSFTTSSFNVTLNGTAGVAKLSASGTYTQGDATLVGEGINLGSEVTNFDNKNNITLDNLDPNTAYTVYYAVKIKESTLTYTTSKTFTTSALELTTQEAKPTSTTSVRLLAATNCDATEGTGFEWRRYDAPAELPSSKVNCPVVDGVLVGSLRGVKDDAYYKYRPYYTSSSGKTYYGDWIAFFTGDANVYFEPEVRTDEDIQVINNSATVKGYALEGTDIITAQGFEYWKTGTTIKPASTNDCMTVNASGISMSATLANLEYNSTYKYRAFVTTAKGTIYGDEKEFSTGEDPAGIEYVEIDADEFSVNLRENPATGTAWVSISGASSNEAQYVLTSMSGAMVATGSVMLDGEWNAIELNCSAGIYLLTIKDGTQDKTLRLIVK